MLSGAGMQVLILGIAALLLCAVWVVLHIVMVVQGFKVSSKWGLASLLLPFGSLVFAFAKSGRRALAAVFLVSFLGGVTCLGFFGNEARNIFGPQEADPATVKAAEDANKKGMDEFDKQIEDLQNLEDIKL